MKSLRGELERTVSESQLSGNTFTHGTPFVALSAAILSNDAMTIDVILRGIKLKALVDSGSDISLIRNNLLQDKTRLSCFLPVIM